MVYWIDGQMDRCYWKAVVIVTGAPIFCNLKKLPTYISVTLSLENKAHTTLPLVR
jgi:hypothetical protein